ncbi:hypothetical protein [Nannocystis sp.]|uniref:hypothetical protein n=1 Tax=Nannocystis sp. TaxID=1962667 RepID=UPI0025F6151C|nr:hypothetical protein [Nannocystis sp.]MBK7823788.1 hypothetical protein [Nannocystis sp.]
MITPIELWNAAEQLAEGSLDGDSEFARRLVISRLYYAVFHSLQAAPATRSLPRATIDGGMHKAFIAAIKQSTDKHLRRAGQRLADLHQRRVDADYNLARPISRMDVAEARHAANAVRSLVAESETPA